MKQEIIQALVQIGNFDREAVERSVHVKGDRVFDLHGTEDMVAILDFENGLPTPQFYVSVIDRLNEALESVGLWYEPQNAAWANVYEI